MRYINFIVEYNKSNKIFGNIGIYIAIISIYNTENLIVCNTERLNILYSRFEIGLSFLALQINPYTCFRLIFFHLLQLELIEMNPFIREGQLGTEISLEKKKHRVICDAESVGKYNSENRSKSKEKIEKDRTIAWI